MKIDKSFYIFLFFCVDSGFNNLIAVEEGEKKIKGT